MSTNSKIGRSFGVDELLKSIPDSQILVEAAMRRGQSMTTLIEPQSPSLQRITLAYWKNAYLSAKNTTSPNRVPLMEVYDNIRIDNTLSSIIDTRILKVQLSRFMLMDKSGKPDTEAKKLLEKEWFWDFIELAMESRFEGFSLAEIWDFNVKTGELDAVTRIDKYHVNPPLGIVTKLPGDDKGWSYIDHPNYITIGKKNDLGLLYKAAVHILAKKYALGTWAEYNEKIGVPFRTVTTPTNDKGRQQQLGLILEKMGSAGWAVLNEGEKVELLAISGTDPTKCFEQLIAKLDAEIAMLICGQSSTSNSQNNKGTYGSMKILQEISDDRHESDKIFLKYLINGVLLPRLVALSPAYKVFANLYFEWDKTEFLTLTEIVDYIVKLSGTYNIDPEYISLKTGIPILGLNNGNPPDPTGATKKKNLTAKVTAFYSDKCCTHSSLPVAISPNGYEADVLRVAKLLFDNKQRGVVDYSLLKKTAAELRDALFTGYTTSTDTKNVEMLKALERNIFVFSGFKTAQQLNDIKAQLKDENGNIRSFDSFKKEALKINQSYNVRFLATEYDNTMVSAQMASQWLDIQKNKQILPFLKFDATLDNRTTSLCRSLDGTTLPVDHPFWDTYYLPLHWHERSIIQQVANGASTDVSKLNLPELQPMFQGNVGKEGVIFPKTHPYYETSVAVRKQVMDAVNKVFPDESNYKSIYTSDSGGEVLVHPTHHADELKNNTSVAKILADNNHEVKLLSYQEGRKNPDASIDGMIADFKAIEKKTQSAIQSNIKNTSKQKAEIAVITLLKNMDDKTIVSALYAALFDANRNKSIKEVWFLNAKKLIKIKRSDIEKGLIKKVL